jgi:hypothetical protein
MRNLRGLDKLVTLIKGFQDTLAVPAKTPAGNVNGVAAISSTVLVSLAVEPVSERRVSLAGPAGVFVFMRQAPSRKKSRWRTPTRM